MPLRFGMADAVHFECDSCRKSHSFRQIRNNEGKCRKCKADKFSMLTEFHEGVSGNHGIAGFIVGELLEPFFLKKLGVAINSMKTKVVRETTPGVPGEEALRMSKLGLYGSKCAAHDFMQARKTVGAS